ncbi:MAG: alpha/beta hydrolase, partial [Bacteroidia bacterium]
SALALFGEKDLQVPAKENRLQMHKAKTKAPNSELKIVTFPNLNHLFQECKTGSPSEYNEIEQTISLAVLKEMQQWLVQKL